MRKLHKAFWISFAVYSLLSLIGAIVIERNENDLGFLINMKGYIPFMKYYSLVGLLFYLIAFIMMFRARLRFSKLSNSIDIDKKELKAKIFDLRQEQKTASEQKENLDSPNSEE